MALLQEPTAVAEGIWSRVSCRPYVYHRGRDRWTAIRTRQLVSKPESAQKNSDTCAQGESKSGPGRAYQTARGDEMAEHDVEPEGG